MTSAEPPPPELPRVKARLPFEEKPFRGALQRGAVTLYGILSLGLAGVALYMATIGGHPVMSGYVAAPAIGAMWFGLRLFMVLGTRR